MVQVLRSQEKVVRASRGDEASLGMRTGWTGAAAPLAVGLLALAARLLHLDYPPFIDELNHVLAARALLEDGTLSFGGDPYVRARGFTYLIAGMFHLFGESLPVARLPAVAAGAALVVLLFVWVRCHAGSTAAWITALLLCFYPYSLFLSQQVRFYTLHALAIWVGIICLVQLALAGRGQRREPLLIAGAILAWPIAYHLQATTIIAAGGAALAALLVGSSDFIRWLRSRPAHWLGVAAATVAAGILLLQTGRLAEWWALFHHADVWGSAGAGEWQFYHYHLIEQYATIWSVFPFVALIALARRFRLSVALLTFLGVTLATHSMAAWKEPRFFYYAMPAFFAISGIAGSAALDWLNRQVSRIARTTFRVQIRKPLLVLVQLVLILVTLRLGWGVNDGIRDSFRMLASDGGTKPVPYPQEDWPSMLPFVAPYSAAGAVLVTSANLKSLYYFGRSDYDLISGNLGAGSRRRPDLSPFDMTGKPVIGGPESLALVHACHRAGLVLVERSHWQNWWAVTPETTDYITQNFASIAVPDNANVFAYYWQHSQWTRPEQQECAAAVAMQ
jgi:hypothetical protein